MNRTVIKSTLLAALLLPLHLLPSYAQESKSQR